ncbi:hypothetical protein [Psychrobacter sp. DAB_AL62B]|uniref:hypothetical protein n=1 Tax=Psychrobacter sp. DAB_AL62B TaxID=1028420 RepID=UPI002380ECCC|nr:hypothetical protein [Psychrobacter sp. DAB_AL62B]MDE4456202.1 hypothetical protein [Psychrobacter sp. DAB_AL62B]
MKVNKFYQSFIFAILGLAISSCTNVREINSDVADSKVVIKSYDGSLASVQEEPNAVTSVFKSKAHIDWSKLKDSEKVDEIKRLVKNYGGELQGLAYSDTGIIEAADIYILNANISTVKRLQLIETLSELIGTPIAVNIQDSRLTNEMGKVEILQPSVADQNQMPRFSIDNDEQVNEVARIVEMYGAKLQSLGYSGDSELNLSISYYPNKFTMSEFENLEADLEFVTGFKVTVFKKSVIIRPL